MPSSESSSSSESESDEGHRKREKKERKHKHGKRERSESRGGSSSSSGSDSDSDKRHRKREKRERKRKHEKKEKRQRKRKREREKKERHKDKKHKKHKKGHAARETLRATASGVGWGSRGIIRESDYATKQEEFLAWLSEHKGVNQEALRQWEVKEHFSTFVEDFNTATLPHEKYYDMAKWYASDKARQARENARAEASASEHVRTDFDDESARRRELQREREQKNAAITQVMAAAMATAGAESSLVADMRQQEAARLQMRAQYAVGDVEKARATAVKMDPKYVSQEELKEAFGGIGGGGGRKPRPPQKQ